MITKTTKAQAIVDYRTKVSDRINRRYGAFTYKANLLQEKNMIRMFKEIRKLGHDILNWCDTQEYKKEGILNENKRTAKAHSKAQLWK